MSMPAPFLALAINLRVGMTQNKHWNKWLNWWSRREAVRGHLCLGNDQPEICKIAQNCSYSWWQTSEQIPPKLVACQGARLKQSTAHAERKQMEPWHDKDKSLVLTLWIPNAGNVHTDDMRLYQLKQPNNSPWNTDITEQITNKQWFSGTNYNK